jgi:hypothetical protein
MFKFRKTLLIAFLVGTLGVIGCGDDATGTGNTNGGGNGSPCADCDKPSEIPDCEVAYNECKDLPNQDECVVASLFACQLL